MIELPAGLSQNAKAKILEALRDVLCCYEERYSGKLEMHFNDGIPIMRHRTDTKRYGDPPKRKAS